MKIKVDLQNKSSSRIVKFSGAFSSTYEMVYSILNRITLQMGSSVPMGSCVSSEKPSKRNSWPSNLMIVGVFVRKFVGGEMVIR